MNFPDGSQFKLVYDENNQIIQDENFTKYLKKIETFSKEGELSLVYNGKDEPYDIEFIKDTKPTTETKHISKNISGLNSRVTFYDNDNYTGSNYSEFLLNSNVNNYNKKLESVYRSYENNIGSGGTVNLKNKVSSIKMEGFSKVQLIFGIGCSRLKTIVIKNHDINTQKPNLSFIKYINLNEIRISCSRFIRLGISNRAQRVIVSFD